jgi:hypothetical protein
MMPGGHRLVEGEDRRFQLDHTRGRELAEKLSADIQANGSEWGVRDDGLAEIYEAQGFHGRPEVLPEAEMDARVASGWVEVWRGFGKVGADSQAEYLEAFRSGSEHYPGLGIWGNGTYTTTRFSEARGYAEWTRPRDGMSFEEEDDAYDDYHTHHGIARMAINPQARGVDYDEISTRLRAERETRDEAWRRSMGDVGRYAAAHGYDYIKVDNAINQDQIVILNRTAIAIQGAQ